MKPFHPIATLPGSRTVRHRFYLVIAFLLAAPVAALAGHLIWLVNMRPTVADGVAGFSERHNIWGSVRYLSLQDVALINGLMVWLMLAVLAAGIMLGWLWHRRLVHNLPIPETRVDRSPDMEPASEKIRPA